MSVFRKSMYDIREGRDGDRDSAIELMWKSFDVTRNLEDVKKEEWAQAWGRPEKEDWSYVAICNSKVVSNISFFADEGNVIRGQPIRFAAVWGVATEPQHRRKDLVRKLFREAFTRMKDEGMSLTVLDPFFKPFYEKFGYALAESRIKHVFKRGDQESVEGPADITTRELVDEDEFAIITDLQKSMTRFGSRMFHLESSIKRMIKSRFLHVFEHDDEPLGCIKFSWRKGPKPHELHLNAFCIAYKSDDVLLSLMELVRQYSVSVDTITMWCDPQVPVRHFLQDIRNTSSLDRGSMMMRVVDFEKYCQSISIPKSATESVSIRLKDEYCTWNNDAFRITPNDGKLLVERISGDPEATLTSFQLSQIIGGLTPPTFLKQVGQIPGSVEFSKRLESIFPADSFVCYQRF